MNIKQAQMLAGFLYGYEGKGSLVDFWNALDGTKKFLTFYKLQAIIKAGE